MNRYLLTASLFLCNIFTASHEAPLTEVATEVVLVETEATTEDQEIIAAMQLATEEIIAEKPSVIVESASAENEEETTCPEVIATESVETEATAAEETEAVFIEKPEELNATQEAQSIVTETENAAIIVEETEAAVAQAEEAAVLAFEPSSFIFDFIMELESLTPDWASLINYTEALISRCQNSQEENSIEETLNLVQAIYAHAISSENNAHGSLSSSLYATIDNTRADAEIESHASNFIAIRLAITRNNDSNPELWLALQKIVATVQNALQSMQAAETTQAEENEIETTEPTINESPVFMISKTAQELLALVKEDKNNSVSTNLYISATTNNTAG